MNARPEPSDAIKARLDWLEQELKTNPDKSVRRDLVREYLDLTDPVPAKEIDL